MRVADFQLGMQAQILAPARCEDSRVAIHHDHFWTRMREFAAYRYPLLARAIGEAELGKLVRAFIAAHPPADYAIAGVVAGITAFLADQLPWASSPVLADLAALDFARSGLRLAAEEVALSADDIAAKPIAELGHVRVRLKRRALLATTRYRFQPSRIHELPRDPQPTYWLVYISHGECVTKPVAWRIYTALERLRDGVTLGDLAIALRALRFDARTSDRFLDGCLRADLVVQEAA
jgi:hypothetical protein